MPAKNIMLLKKGKNVPDNDCTKKWVGISNAMEPVSILIEIDENCIILWVY